VTKHFSRKNMRRRHTYISNITIIVIVIVNATVTDAGPSDRAV